MHNGDLAGAVGVRVGICIIRHSMGRPSGVADPDLAFNGIFFEFLREDLELPLSLDDTQLSVIKYSDPGGIVSPVF